ncbi:methyltransferase domain-containing protein [Halorarius litoreus]|uniref:methyltransferase domain-containing protein n=1 Tax=Halorarius litoreus TaxID=2962676 RepID=UPI0020CCA5B6|nr:methyltransferase domain-containing protein [Halorarius litoreus]
MPHDDAYGEALRAYHETGESFEVVERDDGFVGPPGTPALYFSDPDEWGDHERTALERAEGRVLDVGCGAGRHALYLQERGHDVVGIDDSPGAVEVSSERGVDARQCDVADVRDLDAGTFDTVVMGGNNFGLVGTRTTAPRILGGLAAVTSADARILAETRDVHATDDPDHLAYHEFNRERGRLPGALRIRVRYKRHATLWFDYLMVSPEELREVIEPTVWELVDVVEADDGAQYYAELRKE